MLTAKQVKEIKEHLERAQNPVFFFDNDQDGLCSFLLLQRYIGRGKGVPIKSFPGLNKDYFRKVQELNADYVFILDKPVVEDDFFEETRKVNIPVVWIDHHLIEKIQIPPSVSYYNPLFNKKKSNEPVTTLCYQVTNRPEDMWLAVVGSISDRHIPDFYDKFQKENPELAPKEKDHYKIFYKSDIGKIARIFAAGLKDKTTNVINMLRFLFSVKSPGEVLEESVKNKGMHSRFMHIESKYEKLLKKATELGESPSKLLFFQYSGDLSVSTELSNELNYAFPEKLIVVLYVNGAKTNVSMRGENARDFMLKAFENLEDASGGGHERAVGGRIKTEDIRKFKESLEEFLK